MRNYLIILLFLPLALFIHVKQGGTKPIDADLAIREIEIDHNFTGKEILSFGARNDVGNVVVVVRGPDKSYIVRKKERVAGIWVNRRAVQFKSAPGFYAVSSSRPLENILDKYAKSELGIGADHIPLEVKREAMSVKAAQEFRLALLRTQQESGLYPREEGEVSFWGDVLFRNLISFPDNISKGQYLIEFYLFNDGVLSALQVTPMNVSQVGIEAFIFNLAHEQSMLYGLLCVLLAVAAGWGVNLLFGKK